MLISIEPHITCDFPGGPDPYPPSGSAHVALDRKTAEATGAWLGVCVGGRRV